MERKSPDVAEQHINAVDEALDALHLVAMKALEGKSPEDTKIVLAKIQEIIDDAKKRMAMGNPELIFEALDVTKCLTPIQDFELPFRTINCLSLDCNYFLGQLLFREPQELLRTPNFGPKSFKEINTIVEQELGLKIGDFEKLLPYGIKNLPLSTFGFSAENYSDRQYHTNPPKTISDLFGSGSVNYKSDVAKQVNREFFEKFFTWLKEQKTI